MLKSNLSSISFVIDYYISLFNRLIDLTTRNRKEAELELERMRSSQIQSEKQLESRERCHRQRIKSLEEQIATLRDQLSREIRNRQNFLTTTACAEDEIKHLHNILSDSLHNVATGTRGGVETCVTASTTHNVAAGGAGCNVSSFSVLDIETRRMNDSMGNYVHELPVRNRSPTRRCVSPINRIKFHSRF